MPHNSDNSWDTVISAKRGLFDLALGDVWRYRDLWFLLVRRDFVAVYQQTILGPVWFFVQPLLTTLMFVLVFGQIARISTDGMPGLVFYLSGLTLWNYFAESLTKTSHTFRENAHLFGKVYFPRLIIPLSIVSSNLIKFAVQLSLFLSVWAYYWIKGVVSPTVWACTLPVLLLVMALAGMGLGMLISSMTTKYRDLSFLIQFGVQLLMYATPVIYPLSSLPEKYRFWLLFNPVTPLIEIFRKGFLGVGQADTGLLLYSLLVSLLLFLVGLVAFNATERDFVDTV